MELVKKDRQRREILLQDRGPFRVQDFGAGGYRLKSTKIILQREELPELWRERMAMMMAFHRPAVMLELGPSLGLSTLLMADVCPNTKIYTLEGDQETALRARKLFEQEGKTNIQLFHTTIEAFLHSGLHHLPELDFVFLDANHRLEPTLAYVEALIPRLSEYAVLVLDDIHWSPGMQAAWDIISKYDVFDLSLDLGRMGVLMKRKGMNRQHFFLRS